MSERKREMVVVENQKFYDSIPFGFNINIDKVATPDIIIDEFIEPRSLPLMYFLYLDSYNIKRTTDHDYFKNVH